MKGRRQPKSWVPGPVAISRCRVATSPQAAAARRVVIKVRTETVPQPCRVQLVWNGPLSSGELRYAHNHLIARRAVAAAAALSCQPLHCGAIKAPPTLTRIVCSVAGAAEAAQAPGKVGLGRWAP